MANGEGLGDTVDCTNTIMYEASTNCLLPEIPHPTLHEIGSVYNYIKSKSDDIGPL